MKDLTDRLSVEIFRTHIESLSAAKRLAERLLGLIAEEMGYRREVVDDIRLALSEPTHFQYLREVYHLTPQEAVLLEHLIKREVLSLEATMALLQVNNEHCRVIISRVRRKTGLPIVNYRGEGYALRADIRRSLRGKLETTNGNSTD